MAQEYSVDAEKAELEAIHELDLLTKDWNELPFASASEIESVKEFQSYLSKTHDIDIKRLSPFEMAIFYFGCDGNKVIASNRYLEFLKFSESYKFDTISKESLIKSKTLLRKAYTLGGVIDVAKPNNNNNTNNNDKNDKNGNNNNNNNNDIMIRKCHLCASVGKHIIPSEFDSVNSMIKGLYYNWNELNYWTNFGLSKNYMIIISNLGEIGMKNFSIYGQIAALNLMQHIYPIKIERIYMYDAPLIMQTVVKMIIKLIDVSKFDLRQLNKNKIFKQIDDESQIPMSVGGKYDFIKQVLKIKYSNNGDNGDNGDTSTQISCKN